MWIELMRQSIFRRELVCSSDIPGLRSCKFIYKKRTMAVVRGNETIISTDGDSYLKMDGTCFRTERIKFRLSGLFSDGESLLFDWNLDDGKGFSAVGINRDGHADESYVVRNHTSPLATMFLTKTKIEAAHRHTDANVNLMLACLAFFWTYYENDRTSFA